MRGVPGPGPKVPGPTFTPCRVFIVNFEHIAHPVLAFLLLTLSSKYPLSLNSNKLLNYTPAYSKHFLYLNYSFQSITQKHFIPCSRWYNQLTRNQKACLIFIFICNWKHFLLFRIASVEWTTIYLSNVNVRIYYEQSYWIKVIKSGLEIFILIYILVCDIKKSSDEFIQERSSLESYCFMWKF